MRTLCHSYTQNSKSGPEASSERERSGLLFTERLDVVDPKCVQHRNVEAIGRRVRRELEEPPSRKLASRASPYNDRQVFMIVASAVAAVAVVHRQAVVENRQAVRLLDR